MRILIINRWTDEFADYKRYINHETHQIGYITNATHGASLSTSECHIEIVENFDDTDNIVAAARRCHSILGSVDVVLALSEFDLLTAAHVREALSAPGHDVAATLLFRDKVRMKRALEKNGIPFPRYRAVDSVDEVASFASDHDGAIVVKPRMGAASTDCYIIQPGADPAGELAGKDLSHYEVEEFVAGPIWHVDGLMHHDKPAFAIASRYLNTCYDFAQGTELGSIVQRGPRADQVVEFAIQCLTGLGLSDGAFHIEVIEGPEGLVFLEVGARIGGGEIPFVCRDVYGVDLVGDWIRIILGDEPQTVPSIGIHEHAGFLMLPEPVGRRLRSRTSLLGRISGLYAEELPDVGHLFDGQGGYDTILGRFRYRGDSAEAVERAILDTLARYSYTFEDTADNKPAPVAS
jgi:hypothetical protein